MSASSPFTTKTEKGAYSAIVYKDGDLIVAEDNVGTVVKEGSDATTIIEAAIASLPSGRSWIETVQCIGSFSVSSEIDIPSYTRLDLTKCKLTTVGNVIGIDVTASAPSWVEHVEIIGGIIDATSQTGGSGTMRAISLNNARYCLIDGTETNDGGYYGINLWQSSYVTIQNAYCHDAYRHGLHLGSDAAGRGWYNLVIGGHYNGNGKVGVDDRGSTVANQQMYNQYVGIEASDNQTGFWLGSESTSRSAVYNISDCVAIGNSYYGMDITHGTVLANNIIIKESDYTGLLVQGDTDLNLNNPHIVHNGQTAHSGGIKINDKDGYGAANIVVRGGSISKNWCNIYIVTTAGIDRVVFSDTVATDAVSSNFSQSGTVTDLTMRNVKGYT